LRKFLRKIEKQYVVAPKKWTRKSV
jgi:hypothetical protein